MRTILQESWDAHVMDLLMQALTKPLNPCYYGSYEIEKELRELIKAVDLSTRLMGLRRLGEK